MTGFKNRLGVMTQLKTKHGDFFYFSLNKLARAGFENIHSLPFCIKILLENLLRNEDKDTIFAKRIEKLAKWNPSKPETFEIHFMPSRIILQDFTGVPALVDIAAMRDAAKRLYGDPNLVSLKIPTELVIDH